MDSTTLKVEKRKPAAWEEQVIPTALNKGAKQVSEAEFSRSES